MKRSRVGCSECGKHARLYDCNDCGHVIQWCWDCSKRECPMCGPKAKAERSDP